ncbi:hypothetical protein CERSUDRAFT_112281 [Gelatoporia subvermispora B]|uniref:Uncharacterized protein n=1 Tax=Ceriporiopsis subvermispora (strain B) TaxID=914234 RepID=M2QSQ9_CERS8|nr:hypothetical protein CERSUDRAFT_112281 [Gelatoporia subvermispora B]
MHERLPIPSNIRESRDFSSKVDAMKIFLGVLGNDVIQADVGLSDIDPRRLASGERDEVVLIGEILCWLGMTKGILSEDEARDVATPQPARHPQTRRASGRSSAASPSTHSTITSTNNTRMSIIHQAAGSVDTSATSVVSRPPSPLPRLGLDELTESQSSLSPIAHPVRRRPRCIHEVQEPSFFGDPNQSVHDSRHLASETYSYCDCSTDIGEPSAASTPRRSVRYTGWIEHAKDDEEIRAFETSRRSLSRSGSRGIARRLFTEPATSTPNRKGTGSPSIVTRHNSASEYRLALLNERAKLLEELADLKTVSKSQD